MKVQGKEADERLLVEAARRDPSRFAELYEQHVDRVYAYVLRRVGNRQEAEDVTSQVFHQALEKIGSFEWRGVPFAAWLLRIAGNATADRFRKMGRESTHEHGTPAPEPSEEFDLERANESARLFGLVKDLPTEQRMVIEMRFAEERSIKEIAETIGRTEGAVKQLQFRAIKNLRTRMESASAKKLVKSNG